MARPRNNKNKQTANMLWFTQEQMAMLDYIAGGRKLSRPILLRRLINDAIMTGYVPRARIAKPPKRKPLQLRLDKDLDKKLRHYVKEWHTTKQQLINELLELFSKGIV